MPAISPLQTAGILQRYMQSERLTRKDVAELLHMSPMTIGSFLTGRTSPQRETLQKIEDFLKNEGAMTRFGFPTDVPPPAGSVEPTPDDTEQLNSMGITNPELPKPKQRHYVCASLEDWDFALLVQSIMNTPSDETTKKRLLGSLCSQTFPTLAE